ncbi:MAG: substrate-binding domain-containing protein [Caldilineaceae bacterium]
MQTVWRRLAPRLILTLLLTSMACGRQPTTAFAPPSNAMPTAVPTDASAAFVAGSVAATTAVPQPVPASIYTGDFASSIPGAPATVSRPTGVSTLLNARSSVILPTVDPLEIDANITVGGSAILDPITRRLYRRFVREGYAGVMKIERVGTSEGFRLLCSTGTADIVNAGRPVHADETALCSSISRIPIGFVIGQSALLLVIHPENEFLQSVSSLQVGAILTATQWSDVDPSWPREPIVRFLPDADSDEFNALVTLALNGQEDVLVQSANTTRLLNDEEILRAVEESPFAIGVVNYTRWQQEQSYAVQPLPIKRVLPNEETIFYELYPLTYPLYLYTDPEILRSKPQVAAFLNFYLTNVNEEIRATGYFPAQIQMLDAAKTQLLTVLAEQ